MPPVLPDDLNEGQATSRRDMVRTRPYREISGSWHAEVCLACSGGVDSTALLVLAGEALRREKVGPFTVMHVDHGSRPETRLEAAFVESLCTELGVPFVPLRVSSASHVAGMSQEHVWRERRYAALFDAASTRGIDSIVTAHTLNDQVETILMQMFSGASTQGMEREAQFHSSSGSMTLIRPLLGVTRAELEDVLHIAGVTPMHDPSNVDTRYRRNAVRHDVIPVIEKIFTGFAEPIIRSAELHRRDAEYCDQVAGDVFSSVRPESENEAIVIDRKLLVDLHPAIATRVVRLAANHVSALSDDRELTFERLEAVLSAVRGRTGAVIELPHGVRAVVERAGIRICRANEEKSG